MSHVNVGRARRLILAHGTAATVFVVDHHAMPAVQEILGPDCPAEIVPVERQTDIAAVRRLAERISLRSASRIVGVGGGNVMDLVKLATAASENARILDSIETRGARKGFLPTLIRVPKHLSLALIPTTFGTGSEANASACVQVIDPRYGAAKTLVSFLAAFVNEIAYDPQFLLGPRLLLRYGLFEAAFRILGAVVGHASVIRGADAEGYLLFTSLMNIADEHLKGDIGQNSLLRAARLSARSHTGISLKGRGQAPSPIWLLANEFSMASGLTKNEATARLIVPWTDRVRDGDERWGSADVLNAWLRRPHASGKSIRTTDPVADWTRRFGLPPTRPMSLSPGGDSLASRTFRRYGGRTGLLARFSEGDLRSILDEALV